VPIFVGGMVHVGSITCSGGGIDLGWSWPISQLTTSTRPARCRPTENHVYTLFHSFFFIVNQSTTSMTGDMVDPNDIAQSDELQVLEVSCSRAESTRSRSRNPFCQLLTHL
jgi:hypothetical protein